MNHALQQCTAVRRNLGLALLVGATLVGCAHAPSYRLVRNLDGESREGVFVFPYSYEWFIRGELAMQRGEHHAAVAAYEQALAGPDEDPLLLARLVTALEASGNTSRADDVLQRALGTFPHSESLWLARGHILESRAGSNAVLRQQAAVAYGRAAKWAPRSEKGPVALARLLSENGAHGRAAQVLQEFVARVSRPGAGALRAQLELSLIRHDAVGAAQSLERLSTLAPAGSDTIVRIANALLQSGHATTAARMLRHVPVDRATAVPHLEALIASGDHDAAEALIKSNGVNILGGPYAVAEYYARIDRADLVEETLTADREITSKDKWLLARIHRRRNPAQSAELLADIPAGSHHSEAARELTQELATRTGLTGLSQQLGGQAHPN